MRLSIPLLVLNIVMTMTAHQLPAQTSTHTSVPINAPANAEAATLNTIESTARDYIEGWYTGDSARMQRALHPDLAKRVMTRLPDGLCKLDHMGASQLVEYTNARAGKNDAAGFVPTVRVLDVYQGAASVRVDAKAWIDYLHLSESSPGRWVIVNVLWERKP